MKTFSETIKAFREARGLSLQDLATLCKCSRAHLWKIEQGEAENPSIDLLARLSDALWIDLGALCHVAAQPWKRGAIVETRSASEES